MSTQTPPGIGHGFGLRKLLIIASWLAGSQIIGRAFIVFDDADLAEQSLGLLTWGLLFEVISWAAVPIFTWYFVYLIKRGCALRQLFLWTVVLAAVSEIPYDLVSEGSFFSLASQNPVWALAMSIILLTAIQYTQPLPQLARIVILVCVFAAAVFWLILLSIGVRLGIAPLGVLVIGFFFIFYYLWDQENRMMLSTGGFGAVMFMTPGIGVVFLHYRAPLIQQDTLVSRIWMWCYPIVLGVAGLVFYFFT
ncbi:TraX family protein [Corynebacterium kutscheri]|uniref:TraX protein n=1 Tax=Corynebacterium kutscheri TaxID=35755 RepID=A0A0F6QYI1_9CORY|nr:hypothetical protein [Corynebacterium kutscheri]AKE40587.1 TraX protein [Corynebacterium kutscheri]VEH10982.1 protein traX [Corynebacterium kutscheri]